MQYFAYKTILVSVVIIVVSLLALWMVWDNFIKEDKVSSRAKKVFNHYLLEKSRDLGG